MSFLDVFLQQVINGVSLGAMYALLALGFTMVYGIIELINFAHFNVFMVGSFIALWLLQAMGIVGQGHPLYGLPLIGVLGVAFAVTMLASGVLGVAIERLALPPLRWPIGEATLRLREVLVWGVTLALMLGLHLFVRRTKMGKAMQATAQDQEAARMMGVDVDRVVAVAFFLGSALAGAAGLIFGLYYNYTSFIIGYTAGLKAFVAAVLGGIGSIPGALVGGLLIGLIETLLKGSILPSAYTGYADAFVFIVLILILLIKPSGLFGRTAPEK